MLGVVRLLPCLGDVHAGEGLPSQVRVGEHAAILAAAWFSRQSAAGRAFNVVSFVIHHTSVSAG